MMTPLPVGRDVFEFHETSMVTFTDVPRVTSDGTIEKFVHVGATQLPALHAEQIDAPVEPL